MKRRICHVLSGLIIFILLPNVFTSKVSASDNNIVLEGNLRWYPVDGSYVYVEYVMNHSESGEVNHYSLQSQFQVNSPIQLNGTNGDWLLIARNFSIQLYVQIDSDFYLYQHWLNRSEFGSIGNQFSDFYSFTLSEQFSSIEIHYSQFSYLKLNSTESNTKVYGTGSEEISYMNAHYYPKSLDIINGDIFFIEEDITLFSIHYDISSSKKATPMVEMDIIIPPFDCEYLMLINPYGVDLGISPLFILGSGLATISYLNQQGWLNNYIREITMTENSLVNYSVAELDSGVNGTLCYGEDNSTRDVIILKFITDLRFFNFNLEYNFELRPSVIGNFLRRIQYILILLGSLGVIAAVFFAVKKYRRF